MRGSRRAPALGSALILLLTVLGCASSSSPTTGQADSPALSDNAITVASFDFAESRLLAEIYSQALEAGGYRVRRAVGLGPREFVAPALSRGLVELVPEYAGAALQFLSLGADAPTASVAATHEALRRAAARGHITTLAPAPAQDANTFVVTRETATDKQLDRLSDLAGVAADLTFGGPPECPTRALCLAGLEEVYGLSFKEFVRLDTGGPVTHQALQNGNVDIALLFTTDPAIGDADLVELADDRGLQPAENITPLIRTEVVDRWGPPLTALIDGVSEGLTTRGLRELNGQVAADGADLPAIAARWLRTRASS
jgi:osmoprotectant transport system substrate-binding protein